MSCFCLASFVAQSRACFVEINPLVLNCSVAREWGSRFCSAMLQGPCSFLDSVPDRNINLDLAHSERAKNMESFC